MDARRLGTHPVLWIGTLLSAMWLTLQWLGEVPVLHRDFLKVAAGLIPATLAGIIAGGLTAGRTRRSEAEELLAASPFPPWGRTASAIGASIAGVLPGLLLAITVLVSLKLRGGIGWVPLLEVLAWPAVLILACALGAAFETIVRSTIGLLLAAALLGGVMVAFLQAMALAIEPSREAAWWGLLPWVHLAGDAPEVQVRRPGLHLLYLATLVVLAASAAILRTQRHKWSILMVAGAMAALVVVVAATLQPPSNAEVRLRQQFILEPQGIQTCTSVSEVTYCAYPDYEPFIEQWERVVRRVVSPVPTEARATDFVVRQRYRLGNPIPSWMIQRPNVVARASKQSRQRGEIPVGLRWGSQVHEYGLALLVSLEQVGASETRAEACDFLGEARGVMSLWLAAQVSPGSRAMLAQSAELLSFRFLEEEIAQVEDASRGDRDISPLLGESITGRTGVDVQWSKLEVLAAWELMSREAGEISEALTDNWARYVDERAPTRELMQDFGIEGPELLLAFADRGPVRPCRG